MSALGQTLHQLGAIVGPQNLLTATVAAGRYAIEGQTPVAVASPGSAEEVGALLRAASEAGLSVLLRGSGQHSYLGAPPGPIGMMVSLSRLDQVVEYDAEDLTITAQAGITLGALQKVTGEHKQMLPLDPPGPATATLGGIVSANLAGPMRMRYGSPRDLVIGMKVALPTGEVIKTGGRTVKNVAGYDLGKLFVGSLGSAGAILEVTTRLTPAPEGRAILLLAVRPQQMAEVTGWLTRSPLEVTACEALNTTAARRLGPRLPFRMPQGAQLLLVGITGEAAAMARQEREIAGPAANCTRFDGEQADTMWEWTGALTYPKEGGVLLRASVPLAAVPEMMEQVSAQEGWAATGRPGDGLVYASPPAGEPLSDTLVKLEALRTAAASLGGLSVLEAGPLELKRAFPVWDRIPNVDLMVELKRSFDPAGILGCGRFIPS